MRGEIYGRRYGKLVVLSREKTTLKSAGRNVYYRCRCDCGNEIVAAASNLYQGRTKSCGCRRYRERNNRAKEIELDGKVYSSKEFAELTHYNRKYVLCLLRMGRTPEEIAHPKKGLRQRIAEKYGKTREWVRLELKKGRTIVETNGDVELI